MLKVYVVDTMYTALFLDLSNSGVWGIRCCDRKGFSSLTTFSHPFSYPLIELYCSTLLLFWLSFKFRNLLILLINIATYCISWCSVLLREDISILILFFFFLAFISTLLLHNFCHLHFCINNVKDNSICVLF